MSRSRNLWKLSFALKWSKYPTGEVVEEERKVFIADVDRPDEFAQGLGSVVEEMAEQIGEQMRNHFPGQYVKGVFEPLPDAEAGE